MIGVGTFNDGTTGSDNVALGQNSMAGGLLDACVGIGYSTLINGSCQQTVAIGHGSGQGSQASYSSYINTGVTPVQTGSYNDFLGYGSGNLFSNGTQNLMLGAFSGINFSFGSNNIYLACRILPPRQSPIPCVWATRTTRWRRTYMD